MEYINIIWVLMSYLLGSIPFGYIITNLTTEKNVLKIGWRKTSGSNVFKNIGILQGVLTAFLDVGKGFLAVKIAQVLNLSPLAQAFAGVAAITGHNWSCFLRFAGGRGIGTFVGAALAISPQILGLSIAVPLIIALLWNASPATILLLATFIFLSIKQNQFIPSGAFGCLSLVPIFVKRLSPIKEIKAAKNKLILIRNRLIFDDDITYLEPRIKKLIKKKSWW